MYDFWQYVYNDAENSLHFLITQYYCILLNDNDKQKIVALCHSMIEKGHEYKKMAENPVFQKMFNIQNSKEYALGMILGSYIQTIDDYFKVNYDREMDEDLIRKIKEGLKPYNPKSIEIKISRRINRDPNNPKFIEISEKLEKLKEKYNQKLIDNKEFLKELIDLARSVIQIEKDAQASPKVGSKNALTRIFEKASISSEEIEKIVEKIDKIITQERYDGWQNTSHGTKLIQQKLYRILYDHKLSDDEELFEKAYNYIKEHY